VSTVVGIFGNGISFAGDLSKWDVSKVTDMGAMFHNAKAFDCDVSK